MINKITIDITVMRTDIKTNGRWAEIKFTNNLNDDASRRDFLSTQFIVTPMGIFMTLIMVFMI